MKKKLLTVATAITIGTGAMSQEKHNQIDYKDPHKIEIKNQENTEMTEKVIGTIYFAVKDGDKEISTINVFDEIQIGNFIILSQNGKKTGLNAEIRKITAIQFDEDKTIIEVDEPFVNSHNENEGIGILLDEEVKKETAVLVLKANSETTNPSGKIIDNTPAYLAMLKKRILEKVINGFAGFYYPTTRQNGISPTAFMGADIHFGKIDLKVNNLWLLQDKPKPTIFTEIGVTSGNRDSRARFSVGRWDFLNGNSQNYLKLDGFQKLSKTADLRFSLMQDFDNSLAPNYMTAQLEIDKKFKGNWEIGIIGQVNQVKKGIDKAVKGIIGFHVAKKFFVPEKQRR